jgi:hypothetical protein
MPDPSNPKTPIAIKPKTTLSATKLKTVNSIIQTIKINICLPTKISQPNPKFPKKSNQNIQNRIKPTETF